MCYRGKDAVSALGSGAIDAGEFGADPVGVIDDLRFVAELHRLSQPSLADRAALIRATVRPIVPIALTSRPESVG